MKMITEIHLENKNFHINYCHRVLTIGSCFAENIGKKFMDLRICSLVNPFGITYNPASISESIERIITKDNVKMLELQSCQEIYSHPSFHSVFNDQNPANVLDNINKTITRTIDFVSKGVDTVILTLGTAYVFESKKNCQIVNNCHKLPAKAFEKRLLTNQEINENLEKSIQILRELQSEVQVILTVSPIRHIRSGLVQNQLSKAKLIQCVHEVVNNHDFVHYFPSYEIQLDELRDYRFYAQDMIHPSEMAIDYIWSKFKKTYFDRETINYEKEVSKLNNMLGHKIQNPDSPKAKEFYRKISKSMTDLEQKYRHLDLSKEQSNLKGLS